MTQGRKNHRLYIGIDVGGTKIQGAIAEETGRILAREKCATPRKGGSAGSVAAIRKVIADLLRKEGARAADLAAIGIAIPGVVDPDRGRVVVTPNMNLTGADIGRRLETRFRVPVVVGNDVNLGTLGEHWLGAARDASSAFGIFLGTGIGGGFVQRGRIWRGARESAAEVGHIVMEIGGPKCGCGNRGCYEALASRSAIERDIRKAVRDGEKTALTDLLDDDLSVIRSGALKRALERRDKLVTRIVRRAAEVTGYACLTVRHLVDPEVIVLGGGVVEACGDFLVPIVRKIVEADRLPGAREGGRVVRSSLGDDAVVLGAVALARQRVGRDPFLTPGTADSMYAEIAAWSVGKITIGGAAYDHDVYIRVDGKVKDRKRCPAEKHGAMHKISLKEVEKMCKGGPEVLVIGTGRTGRVVVGRDVREFLREEEIQLQILRTPLAIKAYNQCRARKAALMHILC
jgi:glucokinase